MDEFISEVYSIMKLNIQKLNVEIIGPTGAGKSTHLNALRGDARFSIRTRHRIRQHTFVLLRSAMVWVYLQLRFCFLDTRLFLLKRVCVYYAALKTLEHGDKKFRPGPVHQGVYLVDEGVFHVLLMHRFASLKEKAAWGYFARRQICNLVEDSDVIVFVLSVDPSLRSKRLKIRNEIESERLRVADNHEALPFGPLGAEFIHSVNCDSRGHLRVEELDNTGEDAIKSNVESIKTIIFAHQCA